MNIYVYVLFEDIYVVKFYRFMYIDMVIYKLMYVKIKERMRLV